MEKTSQTEQLISSQVTVSATDLHEATEHAVSQIGAATHWEIILAAALPLLAVIIGQTINRWIDRRPKESLYANVVDFMGPLISPALATIFLMIAGFTMRFMEMELYVLPFIWKLCVAWLAIRLVAMMSSRQSAGWVIALVIIPITLLHLFGVWEPVTEALEGIQFKVGKVKLNAFLMIQSVAAILALFWVTGFVIAATDKRLRRIRRLHISNRMLIMKIFQIVLYFVAFLIGLQLLGIDLTALSVLGGALGVGIGFGLQKIASNFISGIILLFEKSVSVDDMIQLEDGTTGFIRQNAARYTLLETADGREILIPNEEFITQRVTTLTYTNRRGRIQVPVGVAYGTDLERARTLLVQAAANCKTCIDDPAPTAFVTGFGDSAITMILNFWVEDIVEGTFGPRHDVIMEIVRLFAENAIDIPYPHQVQVADITTEHRLSAIETTLEKLTKAKKGPA